MPTRDVFRRPAVDDRAIYDAFAAKFSFPTLAMSAELGLYEILAKQARTIPEIAEHLHLSNRAAEAVVSVVAALGFLTCDENRRFHPTESAKTYLVPDSPFYRRDLVGSNRPEVDQIRRAIMSGDEPIQPFAVKMEAMADEGIQTFIEIMHAMTLPAASGLAEHAVFNDIRRLLDVAGGSGSLSMAIASRQPEMHCTLMDLKPVCRIAERQIRNHGLASQVTVVACDMFQDPWPSGFDGLLFGNIFHDWDLDACYFLASRAFDAMEPGGVICLHEMLLDEQKDGPLTVACYSMAMLLHEKGKQFTASELEKLLTDAGFGDFRVTPSFGYYSLVTAARE
jgi:acetylserotonin N-methyltransferase